MIKESKIIREFSRENLKTERDDTARKIRSRRSGYFDALNKKDSKTLDFYNLEHEIITNENEFQNALDRIKELDNQINYFSSSFLKKLLNHQKIQKLQAELLIGKQSLEDLENKIRDLKENKNIKEQELAEIYCLLNLSNAKIISEDFHRRELEMWRNFGYDFESIEKYFNEDKLKETSLEDYILLLQRFPSNMVTHVTRQGVRDHTGHMFHSGGADQYSTGFMDILGDGKLKSPLGVYMSQENKKQAIEKFLHLDLYDSKEKALEDLGHRVNINEMNGAGSYSDSNSIHFATEEVADRYYGSEKYNEIFFSFPSAMIASQYYYNGNIINSSGSYWNDLWVWINEENGIDLNCGLLFIKKNARVDKITGSRYELDENKNPIINDLNIDILKSCLNMDSSEILKIIEELEELKHKNYSTKKDYEIVYGKAKEIIKKMLKIESGDLLDFLVKNPYSLYQIQEMHKIYSNHNDYEIRLNSKIMSVLKDGGLYYKHSINTISSQDFWENYFKESGVKKPNKIIYYEEDDPTLALYNFRKNNHIYAMVRQYTPEIDMLNAHNIQRDDHRAMAGIDSFRELAVEVINEYFDRKL